MLKRKPRAVDERLGDVEAAKRVFRKMLDEKPLPTPDRIGADAASPCPPASP